MELQNKDYGAHCLILPYPTQGHINPMLQFSKRLHHKGLKITLAITQFLYKTIHGDPSFGTVELISDGYDEGGSTQANSIKAYLASFQLVGSQTLGELIVKHRGLGSPIDCIIYDAFLPWALDVARKFGLVGAVFFTQSCAVDDIYYHVHRGLLKVPLLENEVSLPCLPVLQPYDMPSFVYIQGSYQAYFEMVVDQFLNVDEADWVFVNTFYELEEEVVDWMAKLWRLKTVGPTIPSMYIDQQLKGDKAYGLSIFKPNTDTCINWLNNRAKGSVIYVSFGSLSALEAEQMEEVACGLKSSDTYFMWVVRATEMAKLPKDFVETTIEKGLVVSWCPQLEVLAHEAVGGFLSHCGWNSTLEALSLGVPMVVMPQWTDQPTNAKFVEDVWKTGVRARPDESGIVRRGVLENCIREVIGGERGEEMKVNAMKWKNLAKGTLEQGGSSDRNIDEFITELVRP